jgi:hypothetical protein
MCVSTSIGIRRRIKSDTLPRVAKRANVRLRTLWVWWFAKPS